MENSQEEFQHPIFDLKTQQDLDEQQAQLNQKNPWIGSTKGNKIILTKRLLYRISQAESSDFIVEGHYCLKQCLSKSKLRQDEQYDTCITRCWLKWRKIHKFMETLQFQDKLLAEAKK